MPKELSFMDEAAFKVNKMNPFENKAAENIWSELIDRQIVLCVYSSYLK